MTHRCIDCQHFANAERQIAGSARLGLGKCKVTDLAPATFLTASYARECPKFTAAPAELVARRIQFLNPSAGATP